uniref:ATP synthase complex subunit 8 n=1 Tax=Unilepidotricha sp. 1 SJR-2024a TaxID=3158271 RepID=A0AAU7E565_9NEOP
MPQMMPINWIFLFIIFILTYLIMNMLNYYTFNLSPKKSSLNNFKYPQMNWKW